MPRAIRLDNDVLLCEVRTQRGVCILIGCADALDFREEEESQATSQSAMLKQKTVVPSKANANGSGSSGKGGKKEEGGCCN